MTTLSVVTACWSVEYSQFIPQFWESYHKLNRKPDELILGITEDDIAGLSKDIPPEAKVFVIPEGKPSIVWDYLIRQTTSKWFSFITIDDPFFPEAYDEIDKADAEDAEMYLDSIVIKQSGVVSKSNWDASLLKNGLIAPGVVPMTKELYLKLGMKHEYKFWDWPLQVDAMKAGARVYHANTRRILWDDGSTRSTYSSPLQSDYHAEIEKCKAYAISQGF